MRIGWERGGGVGSYGGCLYSVAVHGARMEGVFDGVVGGID